MAVILPKRRKTLYNQSIMDADGIASLENLRY